MINHDAIRLLDWYFHRFPGQPFWNDDGDYASYIATYRFLHSYLLPMTNDPLDIDHTMDARFLAERLGFGTGNNYFSFATKVLNLMNTDEFPVFDNGVSTVFQKPFPQPDENEIDYPGKDLLDHQDAIYQDILDTYRELENHPVIEAFRAQFNCPDLGYMKILDAIFWRLGKMLDEEGLELTPAEFLREHEV